MIKQTTKMTRFGK